MIIAIDGPAASGKGTLARNLAQHLGYAYLDTGALYRTVAKLVMDAGADPADENAAHEAAKTLQKIVTPALLADPAIRNDEIGNAAAKVAAMPDVRQALLDLQRDFAKTPPNQALGAVLDGRDIGTVICPDANVKLYVVADPSVRAERRTKELQSKGLDATYEAVLADMRARDERDAGRKGAPLKPADDAVVLDTTHLSEQQVFQAALDLIKARTP